MKKIYAGEVDSFKALEDAERFMGEDDSPINLGT